MKPKQIPRTVKAFLLLLGMWAGNITAVISITIWITGSYIGIYLLVALIIGSIIGLYLIAWRKRKTLEEWGIITPKKKRNKQ